MRPLAGRGRQQLLDSAQRCRSDCVADGRAVPPDRSRPLGHLAKLGKHSSVLLVGNILSRGVGMILIPLYTGVLTKELIGYWETLLLGSTLVGMIAAQSLTASLMWTLKTGGRVAADGELTSDQRDRVIGTAIGWAMLSGAVITGAAMALSGPFSEGLLQERGYGTALALLLASQALRISCYPAEGVLKLRFQTVPFVLMCFGEFLVQLVGTILALVVFRAGLEGMAWAALVAAALRFGLAFVYLPEMRRPRLDLSLVPSLVRYSLPLVPGTVAFHVLSLIDRWFFNIMGMPDVGGLYAYGDKWARMVEFLLIAPLVGMWPPIYFNIARDPDARKQIGRVGTLWIGIGGCLAVVMTLMGPVLTEGFDTSGTGEFSGAAEAIGVLTAGYVLLGMIEVARAGFAIRARTRRTAVAMVVAAVVNVILNLLLIPRYGAVGAGWATLLGYGTAVGLCIWLSRRIYPLEWEWRRIAWTGGVLVAFAWVVGGWCPPANLLGPWNWTLALVESGLDTGSFLTLRAVNAVGAVPRLVASALVPFLLLGTGFLTRAELGALTAQVRSRLPARWR